MSVETISVATRDESLQNSPVAGGADDEATVVADDEAKCYWNGESFDDAARICADGTLYECHYSKWMKMPGDC